VARAASARCLALPHLIAQDIAAEYKHVNTLRPSIECGNISCFKCFFYENELISAKFAYGSSEILYSKGAQDC
jgi:hypothetical protein